MKYFFYLILPFLIILNYISLNNFQAMLPTTFLYFPGTNFVFVKTFIKDNQEKWVPFNTKKLNQHVLNKMVKRVPVQKILDQNVCLTKEWSGLKNLKVELWYLKFKLDSMTIETEKFKESSC